MLAKIAKLMLPALLLLVWLVLNENISVFTVLVGLAVVACCLHACRKLLGIRYEKAFFLAPLSFAKFLLFLLKEIYVNGICATYHILKGDIKPAIVSFDMRDTIKNEYLYNVVATSITLTPGTVTIQQKDGVFTVLTMHEGENAAKSFEPFMEKLEKNSAPYTEDF